MSIEAAARLAKSLSPRLAVLPSAQKNLALETAARLLRARIYDIEAANREDLEAAACEGLAAPLLARLKFQGPKITAAAEGLTQVAALPDPVGRTLSARTLDEGLELYQVSCPIGVIAMIFESRPDALVQIAALALKSGNAVLLKGGREALHTNRVLAALMAEAAREAGLPEGWIHLAETRDDVTAMLALDHDIDLMIPRGSNEFVQHIMKNTNIPVLGHADGITHAYVDAAADLEKALRVVVDSKTQYVAVCNALETLLVHKEIAGAFLPRLAEALAAKSVEVRGDDGARAAVPAWKAAAAADWDTEYLDLILSVKVVASLDEAVEHITRHGSKHTETILTEDRAAALRFLNSVDAASVMWNASTRFADGFRFGLGAEVGIGTGKIHARGPVGLEGLCIYKYVVLGNGHIVDDYAAGRRQFTHTPLAKTWAEQNR